MLPCDHRPVERLLNSLPDTEMFAGLEKLPLIMVAPNGARRTTDDHPALPVTVDQIARTAAECCEAGAGAIHVHVRDNARQHVLDAQLYRRVTEAIDLATSGKMLVQITTEAVGRYSPQQQRQLVRDVRPRAVSIAVSEMVPNAGEEQASAELYRFALDAEIAVQHIIYDLAGIEHFADLVGRGIIQGERHALLFPLGRYAAGQQSDPASLVPLISKLETTGLLKSCDWSVCAFGTGETRSLAAALALGGNVRVGFENSLWHADGSLAENNAERVAVIFELAKQLGLVE